MSREHPHFVILIPAFHMELYIARCLRSALEQDYPPRSFRIIFVEDHGADSTWTRGASLIQERLQQDLIARGTSVSYWTNRERLGILGNHVAMLHECGYDEIAVCLDGDDHLPHDNVLATLAKYYEDPNVWLTYGSYEYDFESRNRDTGSTRGICSPIPPDNHTRHAGWHATHLKTFRVRLFRQIKQEDLKFRGEYIDPAGDVALMSPMIEMAGPEHSRFIADTLYLYNGRNPLNDVKIKPAWIRIMQEEVLSRPVYPRLERLP